MTQSGLAHEVLQSASIEMKLNEWNLSYVVHKEFALDDVVFEKSAQVREGQNIAPKDRVDEYAEQMRNGAVFPPILLRSPNLLIDGNTRLKAARRVGRKSLPAIIVETGTPEMGRILGASMNQTGGQRLTSPEALTAAQLMMFQGFPDSTIARELGKDRSQIARWRKQNNVIRRAESLGLANEIKMINKKTLLEVLDFNSYDDVFVELVKLFAALASRLTQTQAKKISDNVKQATSIQSALGIIANIKNSLNITGPGPGAPGAYSPVNLSRASVMSIVKHKDNLENLFDPAKKEEELFRWLQLRRIADEVITSLQDEHE